jgi:P27 family predicted phage terminase small subunit
MTIRGTKPKPTARKKLEGNPGHRPLNPHEPDFAPVAEAPPLELAADPLAVAEWVRLMPLLQRAHVITEGDRASLLALCQQWSRYLTANGSVSSKGMVVRSPSGYPMPNPYIGIANKALGNCVKLWVELGLTPSARTRVQTAPGTGGATFDDAFAEFDDPPQAAH